jgi:Zn finger protein HypA/HybF involved in hydrogenase expression
LTLPIFQNCTWLNSIFGFAKSQHNFDLSIIFIVKLCVISRVQKENVKFSIEYAVHHFIYCARKYNIKIAFLQLRTICEVCSRNEHTLHVAFIAWRGCELISLIKDIIGRS